jgi:hypothetical protein
MKSRSRARKPSSSKKVIGGASFFYFKGKKIFDNEAISEDGEDGG